MRESKHNTRRLILGLLLVTLLLCISGCGKSKKPKDSLSSDIESDLYDKGISMIESLEALKNDAGYIRNTGLTSELQDVYQKLKAVECNTLVDVFRVSHLEDSVETFIAIAPEKMDDDSKKYYKENMVRSMGNMIVNYSAGVKELAVIGTINYETSFVNKKLATSEAYIYCYQDAYPILVTYIPGADGSVRAKATYLFADSLINAEPEVLGDAIRGYFNASSLERITR